MTIVQHGKTAAHAAARLANFALSADLSDMPDSVVEKAKGCLMDFLACSIEAGTLPWGEQTIAYASSMAGGGAAIVGTSIRTSPAEAAFANGALSHGLIREDMHVPSCSHLGTVVIPPLLALASTQTGRDFLTSLIVGYETGARIGRALINTELATRIRPTGTVGAMAGAAGAARLLALSEGEAISALGFGANCACGVNEWPWAGGTDVFFHAGFASRNAVTAVLLAKTGAFASPTAIDGRAGLFAVYGRRAEAEKIIPLADGNYEILSVYWKPAPACNYVQTPCQAALALANQGIRPDDISRVEVRSFNAAIRYPGCDHSGPYPGILEAKMSIQYSVAATLVSGRIEESNYALLKDPRVLRLAQAMRLLVDDDLEKNYPQKQGVEIMVVLKDGTRHTERRDDVHAVDYEGVRTRLHKTVSSHLGTCKADAAIAAIETLETGGAVGDVLAAVTRS
ncbi:MmgE/PrpD family protein [Limoniibacter endophyticus]|uniref:2-methylcitrate dehydratase n=1 Tax=Limoniibacter endophyticus TaxID=1565040 RepID=A0A8J3DKU3_9HYPH|nr:MmgE/PrpD family protein [Limoniibacter endophyticus]GHC78182.1 2-methylcitrate dehydratase [Limoniibacter endophyticus]